MCSSSSTVEKRAEAYEQLGPPFVHVWVAFLRSLAATKGLAPEHVATVKTYWEGNVVKSSPVQLAAHVRHCRAKPCRKIEGKEGWTRIVFSLDLVTLPLEPALEAALLLQKGIRKYCSAPRGPHRERSIEAPGTDAGEVERLARRLEAVSQRMADFLRLGVLEPSLAYAFLMKRGQQVPEGKTKAKGRTRGRAPTNGAVSAPDVSPPRLQPEGPPIAFVKGETLVPSTARPKVQISRESPASVQSSFFSAERIQ